MAAAVLEVPHLDPVVSEKETELLPPGRVSTEVRKDQPQTGLPLSIVMRHRAFAPEFYGYTFFIITVSYFTGRKIRGRRGISRGQRGWVRQGDVFA